MIFATRDMCILMGKMFPVVSQLVCQSEKTYFVCTCSEIETICAHVLTRIWTIVDKAQWEVAAELLTQSSDGQRSLQLLMRANTLPAR